MRSWRTYVLSSAQKQLKVASLSVVFVPDLVQGCSVELTETVGLGVVAAGIEVVV